MIRTTLLALAALGTLASTASAGGYGYGQDDYKVVCHIEKVKVFVGYDDYYKPIFKFVEKKVCEKVYY